MCPSFLKDPTQQSQRTARSPDPPRTLIKPAFVPQKSWQTWNIFSKLPHPICKSPRRPGVPDFLKRILTLDTNLTCHSALAWVTSPHPGRNRGPDSATWGDGRGPGRECRGGRGLGRSPGLGWSGQGLSTSPPDVNDKQEARRENLVREEAAVSMQSIQSHTEYHIAAALQPKSLWLDLLAPALLSHATSSHPTKTLVTPSLQPPYYHLSSHPICQWRVLLFPIYLNFNIGSLFCIIE